MAKKFIQTNDGFDPETRCGLCGQLLSGMHLRDWFAGLAMQSFLTEGGEMQTCSSREHYLLAHAEWAYRVADAMMLARDNDGQETQEGPQTHQ